jgi:tripartite-type tricarboxylate transporter receptor subunit TctC
MTLPRRHFLQLAGAAAAGLAAPRTVRAQSYPTRSVRVIVPFAPGGPTDVFSRLMAQKLSEQTGNQFYVENVGGAGGNIGAARAAQAAPDGYTLLVDGANLVVNPSLYRSVAYDPITSFDPVTMAVTSAVILTVHPSLPAQTVKELVELIKRNPNKYGYASPGTGTPPQLVGELFRLSLGLDLVHVPFKGGGDAISAALGGQPPISFGSMAPAVPLVQAGKLRPLAIASKARSPALPDVPTMAESGFAEVEGESWFAVVVPAGTPKDIIALLNREIAKAVAAPDMKQRLAVLGYEAVSSSPEDCAALFTSEAAKWTKVIRDSGIKGE